MRIGEIFVRDKIKMSQIEKYIKPEIREDIKRRTYAKRVRIVESGVFRIGDHFVIYGETNQFYDFIYMVEKDGENITIKVFDRRLGKEASSELIFCGTLLQLIKKQKEEKRNYLKLRKVRCKNCGFVFPIDAKKGRHGFVSILS